MDEAFDSYNLERIQSAGTVLLSRKSYEGFFKAVKTSIKFDVDEVTPLSDKSAFARTRSTFTLKVLGADIPPIADNNQELFVLRKEADGQWKIARYIFATTNPPAKK